jgi:hypothetical protein
MDRILVQPSEIPTDTMFLATNKNTMIALGYLAEAILGNGTQVDGFNCTPTTPASLSVLVSTGSIYSLQNVDSVAYGTIGTDTADQIVKQGILLGNTTLSCPAPSTSGQSINYLIQVAFSETDTNAQNIQFYNSANPSEPLTENINTLRKSTAIISAKAGTAATTGTQTTPAPDAGFTSLYSVTVANGQATITSGNITQYSTAPFISPKLSAIASAIQNGLYVFAQDTSGTANTITVALSPALPSYQAGQTIRVKVANTTTNNAGVMNVNGLGNVALYDAGGNPLHPGALLANGIYEFVYDGAHMVLQTPAADASTGGALGGFKNLKIATNSNTTAVITADFLLLSNSTSSSVKLSSVNKSYSTGVSGAGGLDAGSVASNTWYYEYIIYNPSISNAAALLSLSATAPALPSGYTHSLRVGATYYGSGALLPKIQYGANVGYVVGSSALVSTVQLAFGTAGNVSTPTFVATSVAAAVPPTASIIKASLSAAGASVTAGNALLAPNANYPAESSNDQYLAITLPTGSNQSVAQVAEMPLESSNIYYASSLSSSEASCLGYTDNI